MSHLNIWPGSRGRDTRVETSYKGQLTLLETHLYGPQSLLCARGCREGYYNCVDYCTVPNAEVLGVQGEEVVSDNWQGRGIGLQQTV